MALTWTHLLHYKNSTQPKFRVKSARKIRNKAIRQWIAFSYAMIFIERSIGISPHMRYNKWSFDINRCKGVS